MTDMKCPFCGESLVRWMGYADCRFWTCDNVLCEAGRFGHIADEYFWQELIRTRKALDIAVDALGFIGYDENNELDDLEEFAITQMIDKAQEALDQIKTITKKD